MANDVAHRIAEYLAERAILLSIDDVAGLRALLADPLTPEERVEVEHLRAWCAKHPDDRSLPVILGALDRLAPVQR